MKTPAIPPIKMPESMLGPYPHRTHQRRAAPEVPQAENVLADSITPFFANHINFNKLEITNAQFHDLAQQLRHVKETMEGIDANLAQMKDALEAIVKIFPPYPPGSSKRIEALRQFSALRNIIDQLTAPQTSDSMVNILADPGRHPHAGDRQIEFAHSGVRLSIGHQPMHVGKEGLDLPSLDLNSSDQQISAAIEKINTAHQTLANRQQAFVSDANGVILKVS
jgi:hypothetical protein